VADTLNLALVHVKPNFLANFLHANKSGVSGASTARLHGILFGVIAAALLDWAHNARAGAEIEQ
jgi:hypothetical protein